MKFKNNMAALEELLTFLAENLGLLLSGILVGGILGATYGYTNESKLKRISIITFGGILIAAIGGGLYFYSNNSQLDTFNVFTIFYAIGFIIIGLIANKIHFRYYRSGGVSFVVPGYPSRTIEEWTEQFGPGFRETDNTIIEAVEKGKVTAKDIAIYCSRDEKEIKERIEFLIKKGLLNRPEKGKK